MCYFSKTQPETIGADDMATTITGAPEAGGKTERVALQAVAGNAEAVTLPEWVRRCTVQFFDSG